MPSRTLAVVAACALFAVGGAEGCGLGAEPGKTTATGTGSGGGETTFSSTGAETTLGVGGSGSQSTGAGGGCQHLDVTFKQDPPTVLILVDRSGSMFDGNYWTPLKTAALSVVQKTQDTVRFGFTAFTGQNGGVCPDVIGTTGATKIAISNYAAVQAAYELASVKPSYKAETPTQEVFLTLAIPELVAVTEAGPKYVLFVTDGEPDHCDDGNPICARDSVVGAVQAAYTQGIKTLVFGLGPEAQAQHLQDMANAGVGAPVQDPGAAFNGCAPPAAGTYAAAGGTTKYYTPTATDTASLEAALSAAISGAKSCTFDLQGEIKVNLASASSGTVIVDGVTIPYDMTNGWFMKTDTQLQFVGSACDAVKAATQKISFDFPCDSIIPK